MVRSTLLFVGGMLVGAAIMGGVVAQRAAADPIRQCEGVAHRTPDASVLPPDPLPPVESGVAGSASSGDGAPSAAPTIGAPAR